MRLTELVNKLISRNHQIAVAESLTGGMLLSELVSVPGASNVIQGGIVCYSTESKIAVLGVPAQIISDHGVISKEAAIAMAQQVSLKFDAAIGVATTGVAGPDLQEGKAAGTVFIAVVGPGGTVVNELHLSGERSAIRSQTVCAALDLLGKYSDDLPIIQGVNEPT